MSVTAGLGTLHGHLPHVNSVYGLVDLQHGLLLHGEKDQVGGMFINEWVPVSLEEICAACSLQLL